MLAAGATRAVTPAPFPLVPFGLAAAGACPCAAPGAAAPPAAEDELSLLLEPEQAASSVVPPASRTSAIIPFVLCMPVGRRHGGARFRGYDHDCAALWLRVTGRGTTARSAKKALAWWAWSGMW
jgi:hypothetical protein